MFRKEITAKSGETGSFCGIIRRLRPNHVAGREGRVAGIFYDRFLCVCLFRSRTGLERPRKSTVFVDKARIVVSHVPCRSQLAVSQTLCRQIKCILNVSKCMHFYIVLLRYRISNVMHT